MYIGSNLIGSIGWGISAVITAIILLILNRAYLKGKDERLKYLMGFVGFRLILFSSAALAPAVYFLSKNLLLTGVFSSLTYASIFLSLIFPPLLFTSFKLPKLKKYYFGALVVVAAISVVIIAINFQPAVYFFETGIVSQFAPDYLLKILYPLAKILSIFPLVILFLFYALRETGWLRYRSLLIGLGFLWVVTTIIVPTLIPAPWGGMYCCVGDVLIVAGFLIRPEKKSNKWISGFKNKNTLLKEK